MTYKAIGLMSGSSLDGLDIVFVELHVHANAWSYQILVADCYPYTEEWKQKLQNATTLSALDYQLLHTEYGHYLGAEVNRFIEAAGIQYQVALIASHGHTTFHLPGQRMTAQLGDGAAIAAETGLPVISDLRALDVALGGQGAPIVPIGEKLLWKEYSMFLNIGGIANISFDTPNAYIAFDVCPANRVLNLLCRQINLEFDDGGQLAEAGQINDELLEALNALDYYNLPFPKSLANDFGTDVIFPMIKERELHHTDELRTYTEHIVQQVRNAVAANLQHINTAADGTKLLITGGGAFNSFLVNRLTEELRDSGVQVEVPDKQLVNYKEALVMALIGVLRWRQEDNVLSSVTGAQRNSIGGALWNGQDA
jgi:anhydro-N-acetylmuramic acid kinase